MREELKEVRRTLHLRKGRDKDLIRHLDSQGLEERGEWSDEVRALMRDGLKWRNLVENGIHVAPAQLTATSESAVFNRQIESRPPQPSQRKGSSVPKSTREVLVNKLDSGALD